MGDKIKNQEKTDFRKSFTKTRKKTLIFPIKQIKKNLEKIQSGK